METKDFLPNRLNFDAVLCFGCTFKELQAIALSSLIICILIVSVITKLLLGMWLIGVGLAFPSCVALTWLVAIFFQKKKQGKPKGFVRQAFLLWLEDKGLFKTPFVRYTGPWSIGRRMK